MLHKQVSRREFIALAGAALGAAGLAGCSSSGGSASAGSASAGSASSASASASASAAAPASTGPVTAPAGKSLVAYFSRAGENYNVGVVEEGSTSIVAHMIAGKVVSDVFEIETVEPYPEGYDDCSKIANQEKADKARPELATQLDNLQDYSMVYLGYPIWCEDLPMVLYTFLESQNWNGITIAPFCTHGGSALVHTVETISEICTGATVKEGLAILGETVQNAPEEVEPVVNEWLAAVRS